MLIFHLLFVGRHPFAGRFRGAGDLSIEKAIAERRFAFSKNRSETLVDPPPASLLAGRPAARARQSVRSGVPRPEPTIPTPAPNRDWVQELEALMKRREAARSIAMHVYYSQLDECPWCRIEDAAGRRSSCAPAARRSFPPIGSPCSTTGSGSWNERCFPICRRNGSRCPHAAGAADAQGDAEELVARLGRSADGRRRWAICLSAASRSANLNGAIVLAAGTVLSLAVRGAA